MVCCGAHGELPALPRALRRRVLQRLSRHLRLRSPAVERLRPCALDAESEEGSLRSRWAPRCQVVESSRALPALRHDPQTRGPRGNVGLVQTRRPVGIVGAPGRIGPATSGLGNPLKWCRAVVSRARLRCTVPASRRLRDRPPSAVVRRAKASRRPCVGNSAAGLLWDRPSSTALTQSPRRHANACLDAYGEPQTV
jgi:hypothetical protein